MKWLWKCFIVMEYDDKQDYIDKLTEKINDVKKWMKRIEEQSYTFEETILVYMSDMAELDDILEK